MEYAKGARLDTEFALGFIAELAPMVSALSGTESGHWRPTATLSPPLGKVEADTGLSYAIGSSNDERLVIVEREASAPGNERTPLKWYEAIRGGHALYMNSGSQRVQVNPKRIVLLLCFARTNPASWAESDLQKTVAFCRLLAGLINRDLAGKTPSFEVHIDARSHAITDWQSCRRDFAKPFARLL